MLCSGQMEVCCMYGNAKDYSTVILLVETPSGTVKHVMGVVENCYTVTLFSVCRKNMKINLK